MSEDQDKDQRLAELQKQLDAVQEESVSTQAQIDAVTPGLYDGSTPLPEDKTASQATDAEIERARVLRDPWASKNALQILRHPPGKRLQWISPNYRERRGMRGWEAVRYADAIGRELHLYINDPPTRMQGMVELGAVVRRGDVVLAWIDEGIFEARRQRGQERANSNLRKNSGRGHKQFGKFGQSTDEGLQDDPDPRYRAKPARGMVSPRRLQEYRDAAVGTHEDARITVQGRRLFDEPE